MFILIWVIVMKRKTKIFLTSFTVSICSLLIFMATGFFYLQSTNETVENKTEKVPFYQVPENKGILLDIDGIKTLFYMNFEKNNLSVIYPDMEEEIYDYEIDYKIKSDYKIVEEIIDILGGIDLKISEETYNYTGAQVVDLISKTEDIEPLKKTVTEKVIEKIGERGMTLEEFVYIIENSETNLTIPDCYTWPEYMSEICKNVRFINP